MSGKPIECTTYFFFNKGALLFSFFYSYILPRLYNLWNHPQMRAPAPLPVTGLTAWQTLLKNLQLLCVMVFSGHSTRILVVGLFVVGYEVNWEWVRLALHYTWIKKPID